jgi:hypothetical protein
MSVLYNVVGKVSMSYVRTYDVYIRCLMQCRDVRQLPGAALSLTVAQPAAVPGGCARPEVPEAVGALAMAVRQCQNNVIRDISTICVSQSESCL